MNTTLGARSGSVTTTDTTTNRQQPSTDSTGRSHRSTMILIETRTDRLGTLDRLAMRLGLALLLWGQREVRRRTPDEVLRLRAAAREAEYDRDRLRSRLPNIL